MEIGGAYTSNTHQLCFSFQGFHHFLEICESFSTFSHSDFARVLLHHYSAPVSTPRKWDFRYQLCIQFLILTIDFKTSIAQLMSSQIRTLFPTGPPYQHFVTNFLFICRFVVLRLCQVLVYKIHGEVI